MIFETIRETLGPKIKAFADVDKDLEWTLREHRVITKEKALEMQERPNPHRIDKVRYYLDISKAVAARSTCLRKAYGAIVVKDDHIVSSGYNGAPRGSKNCCDIGHCERLEMGIKSGERYELCRSVHAEQNAIIAAGYEKTKDAELYLAGFDFETGRSADAPDCCMMCKRVVINAGISKVYFLNSDGTYRVVEPSKIWEV